MPRGGRTVKDGWLFPIAEAVRRPNSISAFGCVGAYVTMPHRERGELLSGIELRVTWIPSASVSGQGCRDRLRRGGGGRRGRRFGDGRPVPENLRNLGEFPPRRRGQGLHLSRLYDDLGYGGLIHHFKNYVLRRNQNLVPVIESRIKRIRETLGHFREAKHVTPEEEAAVTTITQTLRPIQGLRAGPPYGGLRPDHGRNRLRCPGRRPGRIRSTGPSRTPLAERPRPRGR